MIIGISGKQQSGKDHSASIIRQIDEEWKVVKFADKVKDIASLIIGCTREDLEDINFKNSQLSEQWKIWKITISDFPTRIFASYEDMKEYCDIHGGDVNVYETETEILTPRKLLQLIGTDAGRNIIHPNIWVNATMANYDINEKWLITDLRFVNEAQAIKEKGGILIRIERPLSHRFPELMQPYEEYCADFEKFKTFVPSAKQRDFMTWLQDYDQKTWQTINHESETSLDDYEGFDYIIKNEDTTELIKEITTILKTIQTQ